MNLKRLVSLEEFKEYVHKALDYATLNAKQLSIRNRGVLEWSQFEIDQPQ